MPSSQTVKRKKWLFTTAPSYDII